MSIDVAASGRRAAVTGELREHLVLALPLTLGYAGQMLMGLVDTVMLGHFSETAMAGAGIANSLLFTITALGMGVVMGLDTLVPQALGAGEDRTARGLFASGVRTCVSFGLPLTLVAALSPGVLSLFAVQGDVAQEATVYVYLRLPGIIPFLVFVAQRSYLQALGRTRPVVVAMVAANLLNVVLDALLIYGDRALGLIGVPELGLPALGGLGAAAATSVVTVAMMAIAGVAVRRHRRAEAAEPEPAATVHQQRIVALGLPVGLHLVAEIGVFSLVGVLAGRLGETPAAAHQVAVMLASFSFSVALGIGAASSVRVGRAVGSADQPGVRRAGAVGIGLGASLMGLSAIAFVIFPRQLAALFTGEAHVIAAAVPLLRIAAVFQLSDAVQAVAAGALRGAGDTRSTFIANLLGHYTIGLPIAIALSFGFDMGAAGLWWGLVAGLTAVAAALSLRFFALARRPIARS